MQLPCRSGPRSPHSRVNEERNKKCLIEISQYRFSLVISGLTKMLQRVNDTEHRATTPSTSGQRPFQNMDQDRQESIIIVLDTLEKCLANQPKDTTKFEEAMNVKLLLREICQIIGEAWPEEEVDRTGEHVGFSASPCARKHSLSLSLEISEFPKCGL